MSNHHGLQWCSIPGCPCGIPGKPCSRYEGLPKVWRRLFNPKDRETWVCRYCPACGYEKQDHKTLIHKGGKP